MFEHQSEYDMAAMQAMVRVTAKKLSPRQYVLRRWFLIIAGGLTLISGLLLAGIFRDLILSNQFICLAALFVGGTAFLNGVFYQRRAARNIWRNLLRAEGTVNRRFVFEETAFQAFRSGTATVHGYEAIKAAYETTGYFVLILDTGRSVILDRNRFVRGGADGFRAFLERKLGRPLEFVK